MPLPRLSLFLLLVLSTLLPGVAPATEKTTQLISNGGYAVTRGGRLLDSANIDAVFAPGSTIKLVTCLAALETLGQDYRFTTSFFLDKSKTLYIKGSGDPLLTSEAIAAIAAGLAQSGLRKIGDIALDTSLFALDGKADGSENSLNPYDTANGALAVNFNSIPIEVLADHRVISGEKETPLLPIMTEIGGKLSPGIYRVNPDAFTAIEKLPPSLRYTGELFEAMFSQQGIKSSGRIRAARVPEGMLPLFQYTSDKPLAELVRSCLHYSNNFLANQLFLVYGAQNLGWPATWEKGRKAMRAFIGATWPRHSKVITMVEGSGLSRQDQITPAAMLAVLESFKPYSELLKIKNGVSLKSGSLTGVYCYAGYFVDGEQKDPFVILLNQQENNRDELLVLLQKAWTSEL